MSKTFVDALKDRCCSKKELIELLREKLPNLSEDAARKRSNRYLEKLEELGLVEECGDKYCWYIYVAQFKGHEDYSVKLSHSRQLIPALKEIAVLEPRIAIFPATEMSYVSEDLKILVKCAEDHLRTYQQLWGLLENYRKAFKKAKSEDKMFITRLQEKLRKEFGEELSETGKSFVSPNIPWKIDIHLRDVSPLRFRYEGEELWLGDAVAAKGKHLHSKVTEFIECETRDEFNIVAVTRIKKLEREEGEVLQRLQEEMRKLILRIEAGEPLLGECETCPKVYFSTGT
jgi:hypothetical protein